mgnify:FL=1
MSRHSITLMTYDEINEYYAISYLEDRPTSRLPHNVLYDENGVRNIHDFYPIDTYVVLSINDKPVAWRGFGFIGGYVTVGDTYTLPNHRGQGYMGTLREYHRKLGGVEIFGTTNEEQWWLDSFAKDGFTLNPPATDSHLEKFREYYGEKWGVRFP